MAAIIFFGAVIIAGIGAIAAIDRNDKRQMATREARSRAAGKELFWGAGRYRNFCTCSKCNSWTYLRGPCNQCGTQEP